MKKTPGPRAPPRTRRPSLKMTALSYSLPVFDDQDKWSGGRYLDNFHHKQQGERQGGRDEEEGTYSEELGEQSGPFIAHWHSDTVTRIRQGQIIEIQYMYFYVLTNLYTS